MKIRVRTKRLVWVNDTYEYDAPDELQAGELLDWADQTVSDHDPIASEIGVSPDPDDFTVMTVEGIS